MATWTERQIAALTGLEKELYDMNVKSGMRPAEALKAAREQLPAAEKAQDELRAGNIPSALGGTVASPGSTTAAQFRAAEAVMSGNANATEKEIFATLAGQNAIGGSSGGASGGDTGTNGNTGTNGDTGAGGTSPVLSQADIDAAVEAALAKANANAAAVAAAQAAAIAAANAKTNALITGLQNQLTAQAAAAAAEKAQQQQNVIASLKATFDQYKLSSLYSKIEEYVKQGYSADTVALMLRQTTEYKNRFPAMAALAAKGRAISEASYIDYERQAAQFEKQYGLPTGMLTGNVTKLLESDVSTVELQDRVQLAAANSIMAPKELKQTLQDYYNIGAGGLTAYFLDPAVAEPLLQKQAAAAQLGAEAMRQQVALAKGTAEELQGMGVTNAQARQGFQQVAGSRELFSGAGDITSEQEMIQGLLAGNQGALANVNRSAKARVARFQQGGDYLTTSSGTAGLGTAATG